MSERKADEIGPPDGGDDRGGSNSHWFVQLLAAARHGLGQLNPADTQGAPSTQTFAPATAAAATAASDRPFDRLATVELQLIMRCCDKRTLLALARCSRFALAAASHPFAWQPLSPIELRCDWPLELSGRLQPEASLLRHADISIIWRLRSAEAVSAEQVAALAALRRLSGVSFETAFDPCGNGCTQLSDEGAALLFEGLRKRIDRGSALTSLSVIGYNIEQAGGAALAAFIKCSRSLASFHIIGVPSALTAPLSTALARCRTLTSLDVHSTHSAMETVRAMTAVVQQSSSLATFKLHRFELGDAGVVVLAAAVAQSRSLTDLQFNGYQIGYESARVLAAALEQNGRIRNLDLRVSRFGATDVAALAPLLASDRCALTSLNVSSSEIDPEGALALSEALRVNRTLTELCLSSVNCSGVGMAALLGALQQNLHSRLRVLGLSHNTNSLNASCAHSLAEVISRSLTLERLELGICRLGDEGMAALAAGIGRSRSLQHLDVARNSFGAPGATALAAAIATCPTLTWLRVSGNEIGDLGMAALAPALVNLRTLDVNRCDLTQSSARPLAALIQHSRVLESLDVSDNELEVRGASEIAAALQPSSSIRILNL
jgi:Ran GTPase-activating protein (RanGAP) involved in mRNA processing and transport